MKTKATSGTNPRFALKHSGARPYLFASGLLLAISIALSFQTQSWTWVSRSGGVIVLFGVLLSLRKLFRLGPQQMDRPVEPLVKPGGQFNLDGMFQEIHSTIDNYAQAVGVGLMVAGTVLASYADAVLDLLAPF